MSDSKNQNDSGPESEDVDLALFSGAMDELVNKYDQIIGEFKEILDQQTKKIFNDPELEDK
jgi:hypothetical protein